MYAIRSYYVNKVSFKKSIMRNCRFRDAIIKYCDFRYSEIINSTFENSFIEFCDFYRTQFVGNNIFYYSKISNSSIPSVITSYSIHYTKLYDSVLGIYCSIGSAYKFNSFGIYNVFLIIILCSRSNK